MPGEIVADAIHYNGEEPKEKLTMYFKFVLVWHERFHIEHVIDAVEDY